MNTLYYGDNLDVLERHIADESVDLVYLEVSTARSRRCTSSHGKARRRRVGRRPWPDHFFGGSGPVPGAHTVVVGKMPAT